VKAELLTKLLKGVKVKVFTVKGLVIRFFPSSLLLQHVDANMRLPGDKIQLVCRERSSGKRIPSCLNSLRRTVWFIVSSQYLVFSSHKTWVWNLFVL